MALLALVLVVGGCATERAALDALFKDTELPATTLREAPDVHTDTLARAVHRRVNEVRGERGLPLLAWSEPLAEIARDHSRDMAAHVYFSHTNSRGEDPSDRAARAGFTSTHAFGSFVAEGIGENIFLTHLYEAYTIHHGPAEPTYSVDWKTTEELAEEAVSAWMQSPSHRANLLSPDYVAEAIGVVRGDNYTVFITQNFCYGSALSSLSAPLPLGR